MGFTVNLVLYLDDILIALGHIQETHQTVYLERGRAKIEAQKVSIDEARGA